MSQQTQDALQGLTVAQVQPEAASPLEQNPVMFHRGPSTYPGPFRVTAAALRDIYGTDAANFGATRVLAPAGPFTVKDAQYAVGTGQVGIRPVRVADGSAPESAFLDDLLRRDGGLRPEEPVYALVAYATLTPATGTLPELLGGSRREMAFQHMGAYLGEARTSNAPEGYHNRTWGVRRYPANVAVVSLDGVDQATLNRNAHLADAVLNDGVQFPSDYTNAMFRPIDLNTTLMFYRDWMRGAAYLRDPRDRTWWTYCSAHKTIVTNVFLNVPHNADSFAEIFGAEGPELWNVFRQHFARIKGRPFTPADETRFTPLWRREGFTREQIRPFRKEEYDEYNRYRTEGRLPEYPGFMPLPVGRAMAWTPLTTADLLHYVMNAYFDFPSVMGIVASGVLYGFMGETTRRMDISTEAFLSHMMAVSQKLMAADARVLAHAGPDAWLAASYQGLYAAFGGTGAADAEIEPAENTARFESYLAPGFANAPDPRVLAQQALALARQTMPQILAEGPKTVEQAYAWYQVAAYPDLLRAREQLVGKLTSLQYYTPPVVAHLCSIGMHPTSFYVRIREVATAMDQSETERTPARPAEVSFTGLAQARPLGRFNPRSAQAAALAVADDLRGPGYYRDPAILAGFLRERLPELAEDRAAGLADRILAGDGGAAVEDLLRGAGFA
jgi:hypothetical protein